MNVILWSVKGEKVRYIDDGIMYVAITKTINKINKYKKWIVLIIPVYSLIKVSFALASVDWTMSSYFSETGGIYTHPHGGIDFPVPENTPVRSITDGKVIGIYDEGNISFGKSVHILDTHGREVIYGHLSKFECHVGEQIHIGDEIARSGNTGHSTGSHVHIEVRINGKAIDPMPIMEKADREIRNMET